MAQMTVRSQPPGLSSSAARTVTRDIHGCLRVRPDNRRRLYLSNRSSNRTSNRARRRSSRPRRHHRQPLQRSSCQPPHPAHPLATAKRSNNVSRPRIISGIVAANRSTRRVPKTSLVIVVVTVLYRVKATMTVITSAVTDRSVYLQPSV